MSKLKRKFTLLLFIALIIAAVFVVIKTKNSLSDFTFGYKSEDTIGSLDAPYSSQSFNTLLIGTDKSGLLTDAIMLVNVNKQTKTVRMLSIPRDTKVKVQGKNCKINACYAKGGVDLLIQKVKELTFAPVNYYAVIKPGTLAKIVDCLGGVEYEVEQDMHYCDPAQDLYIDLKAGKQILNGDMAEQYCRYRSYALGDLQRTKSQQKFFKALFEQKLKLKYVTKIKSIYNVVSENLESNVTFKEIAENITVMQMISDPAQIETVNVPGEFNDMKKEGISYFIINSEHIEQLKRICAEKFDGIEQN